MYPERDRAGPDKRRWEEELKKILSNPLLGARVTTTWASGMVLGAAVARVDRLGWSWGQRAAEIHKCYRGTTKLEAVTFMSDGEVRRVTPEAAAAANETLRMLILKEAGR